MSMLARLAATGGAADKLYVDDVFSTWLYTGNGSTQTINNGIDLAGKGGLVWSKSRASAQSHFLIDSATGRSWGLSNATSAFTPPSGAPPGVISSFNSNGYTLGINSGVNLSGEANVSWTFRKAAKFFDCGTYTGNGVAGRQIPHSLGVAPGMVIVKNTNVARDWAVWHRSLADATYLKLNTTEAAITNNTFNVFGDGASQTSTHFTVGKTGSSGVNGLTNANASGEEYVWYALAHDTSAEGIIQCGSFTTDGSGNGAVNLGWEPQFCMLKASSTTGNWQNFDVQRGWVAKPGLSSVLFPNASSAENANAYSFNVNAQGFDNTGGGSSGLAASQTYIYLAIRRPNKPPTSGTQVYNAIARTGTGAAATVTGVGFAPDLWISQDRNVARQTPAFHDRLRGAGNRLQSSSTNAEDFYSNTLTAFGNDGVSLGADGTVAVINSNLGGDTYVNLAFRRATGVFDQVCYTGTGSARTVAHNLGAVPELIVVKERSNLGTFGWSVYAAPTGNGNRLVLNTTAASAANTWMNSTDPTASVFSLSTSSLGNQNTATYTAYLWASMPGISKVGSYTGNGSSQTIDCGFATGARFVLIKRTDSTGDWYVWDSVRGIVAANDPHLSLNTTAAEVTTNDSIDPTNAGFIVNQVAATNVNVTSATYVYLAFA